MFMAAFGQCVFGTAVTTVFHPIAYAKVLIQVNGVCVELHFLLYCTWTLNDSGDHDSI